MLLFLATTLNFGGTYVSGSILFAGICALLAASKGRSPLAWGLAGFFLQCFGLLFVLCAGDVNNQQGEDQEMGRRHRRRINERLKREASKIESVRSEMRGRLDAHDIASGIDTRAIRRPLSRPTLPIPANDRPRWFYEDDGETAGPVAERALLALVTSGVVRPTTLVWREGMSDWATFRDVKELA